MIHVIHVVHVLHVICAIYVIYGMYVIHCHMEKMVNSAKNNQFFSARDEVFATQLQAEVRQVLAALMAPLMAPWHHGMTMVILWKKIQSESPCDNM